VVKIIVNLMISKKYNYKDYEFRAPAICRHSI
jgi:hypothetical protein